LLNIDEVRPKGNFGEKEKTKEDYEIWIDF
jgi:hypothetical protein